MNHEPNYFGGGPTQKQNGNASPLWEHDISTNLSSSAAAATSARGALLDQVWAEFIGFCRLKGRPLPREETLELLKSYPLKGLAKSEHFLSKIQNGQVPLFLLAMVNPDKALQKIEDRLQELRDILNYCCRKAVFRRHFEEGIKKGFIDYDPYRAKLSGIIRLSGPIFTVTFGFYGIIRYFEEIGRDHLLSGGEIFGLSVFGLLFSAACAYFIRHLVIDDTYHGGWLIGRRLKSAKDLLGEIPTREIGQSVLSSLQDPNTWYAWLQNQAKRTQFPWLDENNHRVSQFCEKCASYFKNDTQATLEVSKRLLCSEPILPSEVKVDEADPRHLGQELGVAPEKLALSVFCYELIHTQERVREIVKQDTGLTVNCEDSNCNTGETDTLKELILTARQFGVEPDFVKYGEMGSLASEFYQWLTENQIG